MSRKCPKCGREYPDGVMYCFDCKVKLIESSSNTVESKIEYIGDNGRKKTRKISGKSLTFIVSALCVTAIGAAVLFALGNGKKNGSSDEVEAKSEIPAASYPTAASETESSEQSRNDDTSKNTEESQPGSESAVSCGDADLKYTLCYLEYKDMVSGMKATDEKYNLTTFDYSTFSLENQYDNAEYTNGAYMNIPGSSYTMISDQFKSDYANEIRIPGTRILCSQNTRDNIIDISVDICHGPKDNIMTDSERNFFKVVLRTVLQSDYDKAAGDIENLLNFDNVTMTMSNGVCDFYEKTADIGNIKLIIDDVRTDDVTVTLSIEIVCKN